MRAPNFNVIPEAIKAFDNNFSLEMFRRMCLIHYFEKEAAKAHEEKKIKLPVYLSLGQESIAAAVSMVAKDYFIFAQHRAHSVYLAFGGSPVKLKDELLGKETGCNKGHGGSPMIDDLSINMIGHHGLIGENVPLGVGFAFGGNKNTVCFFGDAAAEEDYFLPSIGFAVTHKLPVLFICEDNDLAVLTRTGIRRSWSVPAVVASFGAWTVNSADDPWTIMSNILRTESRPLFVNCKTCRHLWHFGSGNDGSPEWDRFSLTKQLLKKFDLESESLQIEETQKKEMQELWTKA